MADPPVDTAHEHAWERRPVYKSGRSIYTCDCGAMAQDENESPIAPGKLIPIASVDTALDAMDAFPKSRAVMEATPREAYECEKPWACACFGVGLRSAECGRCLTCGTLAPWIASVSPRSPDALTEALQAAWDEYMVTGEWEILRDVVRDAALARSTGDGGEQG